MVNDLYQEIILDHSKRPRNFREMEDANRKAEGYNPLCGDQLQAVSQGGGRRRRRTSASRAPAAPFPPPRPR